MAIQNKTTLKGHFETGDVPNQTQYGHLIDSQLNLAETGTIIAAGTISASSFIAENHITSSGNISSSGNVYIGGFISASGNISSSGIIKGVTGSFGRLEGLSPITVGDIVKFEKDIEVTGTTTFASTNAATINLSNTLTAVTIKASGNLFVTGSTLITGSLGVGGTITAGNTTVGALTATTVDTGQGATEVHLMDQNVRQADAVTFTTVNTGQGANELYDMNQNVKTTDAVTFTTVNTGQGATEVHLMNQNLRNSDHVTFTGITLTKESTSGGDYEGTITSQGKSFTLTLAECPVIPGKEGGLIARSVRAVIINQQVVATSVVLATVANDELSVSTFAVKNGSFAINLGNEAVSDFGGGNVVINFIVL